MLTALSTCTGRGEECEKEGMGVNGLVIIANIIYIYILLINIMFADFHHLLLS